MLSLNRKAMLSLAFVANVLIGCAGNPNSPIAITPVTTVKSQATQVVGQGANSNLAATITNAGNGGAVEVPQGYSETITTPILITQSNLTITCDPDTAITLGASIGAPNLPGSALGMITVESGAGLTMTGCNLVSTNNSNTSGIVGSLLVAQSGATNLSLVSNTFTNCYYYCIFAIDVPVGYIHANSFTGIRSDAMDLTGNTSNFIIDDNRCDATGIPASPGHKCVDAHSAFGLITGNTSTASTTITSVTNIVDLAVGTVLTSPGLATGTTVTSIGSSSITVSTAPLTTTNGLIMTMSNLRQLSGLTIANNQMISGTGFCVEVGDFGGAAPVNIVVTGNSCITANLTIAAPNATFTGTTTAGSATVIVSSTTGIAKNQNISGYGLSAGSLVNSVGAGTITLSLPATQSGTNISMITSAPSGGYSFQNVQGLSMSNNSFSNSTGFAASPGAIEIVGDTSAAPFFVGKGPTTITGGTLSGGGISINTVSNVSISGVTLQQLYPIYPGYYGAISIGDSNNINITGGIIDTRGVGPNNHDAVYDLCNKSTISCSNVSINGVSAIDDGQSTGAAYHLGFASGTDMGGISITDGSVKGYTNSAAAAYFINTSVTNIKIEGMDDSGNYIVFSPSGQTPGPGNTQLYYAP